MIELGDSGWGSTSFHMANAVAQAASDRNQCRELVEVPGGDDYILRRLIDNCPNFCWKYVDSKMTAHYYFEEAAKAKNLTSDKSSKMFYAHLPYFSSPFEISVQPRFLDTVRENLNKKLLGRYATNPPARFQPEQLLKTVPCAFKQKNEWYRGQIVDFGRVFQGMEDRATATILYVDLGVERIVPVADLRPLLKEFGRVPPLALKCRVKDVFINDLDTYKVELFRNLIESIDNNVRVEICTNEEPFFVNLFHPTKADENLGSYFYRPADHAVREEAKRRKWLEHKKRQANENDSDFDDEDSERDEEEEGEPTFIRSFARSSKFPRGVTDSLRVVHVENSILIYLRSTWMESQLEKISQQLIEEWGSFPSFECSILEPGTACAFKAENEVYRAVFESQYEYKINLFLLDFGKYIDASFSDIRAIPYSDNYILEPMMYLVSLEREYNYFPHPSETMELKQIIPVSSTFNFNAIKSRNRIPVSGKLFNASGVDIGQLLETELSKKRIDVKSRDVLPYTGTHFGAIDLAFVHRLQSNQTLVKGKLLECILSEF